MGIGASVRSAVTSAINNLGSTIIITPYTQSSTDSGYSGQIEDDDNVVNETAIPFEEFKTLLKQKFGDLESSEFQLALKSTATFDIVGATKYKLTYQGDVYDIRNIRRYAIEDVLVAWIITLSKRFTNDSSS